MPSSESAVLRNEHLPENNSKAGPPISECVQKTQTGAKMTNLEKTAECINIVGRFCGRRDINALSRQNLMESYGIPRVDLFLLFGGSIPCAAELFADAVREKIAAHYLIVGGEGHTTESLRRKMAALCPGLLTEGKSEAEVFAGYLSQKYGISPDYLETASTNCGNNVTNALELIKKEGLPHDTILLMQDASMQLRMDAGFRKYLDAHSRIINFACYQAEVIVENNALAFRDNTITGLWDMERYITLLMGEIPRLRDDSEGYGPHGKNFIAHVDIPEHVEKAYAYMKENYGDLIRIANPAYATIKGEGSA